MDGSKAGGDSPNRLRSARSPGVAHGALAVKRRCEEPLRLIVRARGDDPWCWVAIRDPVEAGPLAFEVDAGASRSPLQELIVDPKRQSTEIISPDEVGRAVTCKLRDDLGNGIISKRV